MIFMTHVCQYTRKNNIQEVYKFSEEDLTGFLDFGLQLKSVNSFIRRDFNFFHENGNFLGQRSEKR
jgi:hypothetical protein